MNIVFDLDEVLCDFITPFLDWYNSTHGTSYTKEQWTKYRFHDAFNLPKDYEEEQFRTFNGLHLTSLLLVTGAREGIKALKQQGHVLYIATARTEFMHPDIIPMTEIWVARSFPKMFSDSFYRQASKLQKCLEVRADVVIDDNAQVIEECSSNGIRAILFDCCWNRDYDKLERVCNWQELMEKLSNPHPPSPPSRPQSKS